MIATTLAALALATSTAAQETAAYDRLVDTYAAGGMNEAATQLAHWSREDVTTALKRRVAQMAPSRLRAAAMLHTDLAAAIFEFQEGLAEFHLASATNFINRIGKDSAPDSAAAAFVRHWYQFVPTLFVARGLLPTAEIYVKDGLGRNPHDHVLFFLRGLIAELSVSYGLRGARALDAAVADFNRALELDDRFVYARLRVGRIHFLQGDSRARAELESALTTASDDVTRYLAHLFLGALAERDTRLPDALTEYEAARTLGPRYQTPYLALSRAAESAGDGDRARRMAAAMVDASGEEDPWWNYRFGGLNLVALALLRDAARAP